MRLVVDASVAVKWIVEEDGRDLARQLLTTDAELLAPDFVAVETASVLWKKVRRREMSREQAKAAASAVLLPFAELVPTSLVTRRAFEMALELGHPVYDCLYLASAEILGAQVVTSDHRMLAVIAGTDLSGLAAHLSSVS